MNKNIKQLNPTIVWDNFYKLTQIPRPSKKEQNAAMAIKEFGEQLGFETIMDKAGNVIIKKPATPGLENRKTVVLQGHIDMVPQANSDIVFDFEKQPIEAYIDGEWVTANGTTLGADNGIGVACAMAVLQDKDIAHGPIEVLVTVDEETGMTGAIELEPKLLKGDILINLDTEDVDEISVGCAGGVNVNALWSFNDDSFNDGDLCYEIAITGLKGGHSGLDIHLGRGNACKMMGRLLKLLVIKSKVRLASIKCGNMRNAIPREGFAKVVLNSVQLPIFNEIINEIEKNWKNELGLTEPNLSISIHSCEMPNQLIPEMVQDDLINAICAVRNGIIRMSDSMPGVVETSTNLSIVRSEPGKIYIQCLTRSFIDSARDGIASSLESCFQLAGAKVEINGAYPGWKPNPTSEILGVMKNTFNSVYNKTEKVVAMHAGLECGILGAKYPNWDMVSIGPTIKNPHSPDEKVHIGSVANFWEFLKEVLKNVPEK